MEAKEAIVIVVGARPPEFQRKIVRDRHTGKLVEVELNELAPVDPGSRACLTPSRQARRCGATIRP
jgi:hypothetical protein